MNYSVWYESVDSPARPAFGLSVARNTPDTLLGSSRVCTDTQGVFGSLFPEAKVGVTRPGLAKKQYAIGPNGRVEITMNDLDPDYASLQQKMNESAGALFTLRTNVSTYLGEFLAHPGVRRRVWGLDSPSPCTWHLTDNPLVLLGAILLAAATEIRFARLAEDAPRGRDAETVIVATLRKIEHLEQSPGYFVRWNQLGTWVDPVWTPKSARIEVCDLHFNIENTANEPAQDEYTGLVLGVSWAGRLLRNLSGNAPSWKWLDPLALRCMSISQRCAQYAQSRNYALSRPCPVAETFTTKGSGAQGYSYGFDAAFHHALKQEQRGGIAQFLPVGIVSPKTAIASFWRWITYLFGAQPQLRDWYTGSFWSTVGLGAMPWLPRSVLWRITTLLQAGSMMGIWYNYTLYDRAALAGFDDDLVSESWPLTAFRSGDLNTQSGNAVYSGLMAAAMVWFGGKGTHGANWVAEIEARVQGSMTNFKLKAVDAQSDLTGDVEAWTVHVDSVLTAWSMLCLALDVDIKLPWKKLASSLI